MTKQQNDYWKKRAIRDSVKMFLTTEETEKLIDQAYDHAERLLTNEIHKLLKRAQTKSGYDVDKLIRILQEDVPTSELLLLNEAVKTTKDKKRRKELRTMLNLLAIQYRISRLDVLHAKATILAKKIGEQQEKLSTRLFKKIIQQTHQEEQQNLTERKEEPMEPTVLLDDDHHPHPLVQLTDDTTPKPPKGTTVTKPDITTPKEVPKAEMEELLSSKWKGANFSQRIWKDTDELARKLQELFAVEQMTGMAEKDIAKEIEFLISDAFLLHKNIARRLVRTEANRFHTQAKIQQWQKMGLQHVKYVAVLDKRTSHICMELDGSIFRLDELETGKNCPPMHPWCRSIIQAYFGEVVEVKRNKDKNKRKPISKERQRKLTEEFRKKGGHVWQDSEAERYLDSRNAAAMCLNSKEIVLRPHPTLSEVLEELYHAEQWEDGRLSDNPVIKIKCEIEAQHYLLSVEKLYNIPNDEIEQTKRNLLYWEGELDKHAN